MDCDGLDTCEWIKKYHKSSGNTVGSRNDIWSELYTWIKQNKGKTLTGKFSLDIYPFCIYHRSQLRICRLQTCRLRRRSCNQIIRTNVFSERRLSYDDEFIFCSGCIFSRCWYIWFLWTYQSNGQPVLYLAEILTLILSGWFWLPAAVRMDCGFFWREWYGRTARLCLLCTADLPFCRSYGGLLSSAERRILICRSFIWMYTFPKAGWPSDFFSLII